MSALGTGGRLQPRRWFRPRGQARRARAARHPRPSPPSPSHNPPPPTVTMADLEAPGSALPPWLFFAHRSILVFVFAFSEIANFSELSSEMSGKNTKPRQRGFELLQEVREKLAARGRTIKHTVVAAQVREKERERERERVTARTTTTTPCPTSRATAVTRGTLRSGGNNHYLLPSEAFQASFAPPALQVVCLLWRFADALATP